MYIHKNKYTDHEMLSFFRKDGNKEWLGAILSRYTLILLGVANKYLENIDDAKDIVQQVFIKALYHLEHQDIENIAGWLYSVTKNACYDELRKQKRIILQEEICDNKTLDDDDIFIKEQDFNTLELAIAQLKEEQKICIYYFYFKEKSYQDIATITGYELKKVKSNIQNGRRNLKIIIENLKFGKTSK